MSQLFIQSFVRAEVTIGIILSILLITGRSDPQTIAFSLGGIAVFVFLQGLIPLTGRKRPSLRSSAPVDEDAEATAVGQPAVPTPPCAMKPFRSGQYFLRTSLTSAVILLTAVLMYWLAPPVG